MLYIIRGLPGSGKSTLAKKIAEKYHIDHYEADMYFIDENGEYKFDKQRLEAAHEWCVRNVMDALYERKSVIVSNTFTKLWELEDYLLTAKTLEIPVKLIECVGNYGSIHGIPPETFANMKKRYTPNDKLFNPAFDGEIYLMSYDEFVNQEKLS